MSNFYDDDWDDDEDEDDDRRDRLSNERADALRDDPTLRPDDDADFAAELEGDDGDE